MSALWIRLRQGGKILWWVLPFLLIGLAYLAWRLLKPKTKVALPTEGADLLQASVLSVRDSIAAANAQAAVELSVARTKDAAVQGELKTILGDTDAKRRRRNLIALSGRVEQ
jgi:hypothetical protein